MDDDDEETNDRDSGEEVQLAYTELLKAEKSSVENIRKGRSKVNARSPERI